MGCPEREAKGTKQSESIREAMCICSHSVGRPGYPNTLEHRCHPVVRMPNTDRLSFLSQAVIKYTNQSNLKGLGFQFTLHSYSLSCREVRAAGACKSWSHYIPSQSRAIQFTFSTLDNPSSPTQRVILFTIKVNLPLSIKLPNTIPH